MESPTPLVEEPEAIVGYQTRKLRNEEIELMLVQWKHSLGPNQTWEKKYEMMKRYPHLNYDTIPGTESL